MFYKSTNAGRRKGPEYEYDQGTQDCSVVHVSRSRLPSRTDRNTSKYLYSILHSSTPPSKLLMYHPTVNRHHDYPIEAFRKPEL